MLETDNEALARIEVRRVLRPGQLIPVPPRPHRPTIDPVVLEAFCGLYDGLKDANENGTGYSPKVAEAMKVLKVYFSEPDYWRSMVDNNRSRIEKDLNLRGYDLFPSTESGARDLYLRWCNKVE